MKFVTQDYYEILNLKPGAGGDDVKRAYRAVRQSFRPDSVAVNSLYSEEESEAICSKIDEAFHLLSNGETARRYKRYHRTGRVGTRVSQDPDEFFEQVHRIDGPSPIEELARSVGKPRSVEQTASGALLPADPEKLSIPSSSLAPAEATDETRSPLGTRSGRGFGRGPSLLHRRSESTTGPVTTQPVRLGRRSLAPTETPGHRPSIPATDKPVPEPKPPAAPQASVSVNPTTASEFLLASLEEVVGEELECGTSSLVSCVELSAASSDSSSMGPATTRGSTRRAPGGALGSLRTATSAKARLSPGARRRNDGASPAVDPRPPSQARPSDSAPIRSHTAPRATTAVHGSTPAVRAPNRPSTHPRAARQVATAEQLNQSPLANERRWDRERSRPSFAGPLDLKPITDEVRTFLQDEFGGVTGAYLRAVRETQGVALEDISHRTKISMGMLLAIESEVVDDLPARVYLKGYLDQISRLLRLPRPTTADRYLSRLGC